jgi:hypothetical protein
VCINLILRRKISTAVGKTLIVLLRILIPEELEELSSSGSKTNLDQNTLIFSKIK